MSNDADKPKPKESKQQDLVLLELNPASGVDVLGDAPEPLLWIGVEREFTRAEASNLLELRNAHGTPLVRTIKRGKK